MEDVVTSLLTGLKWPVMLDTALIGPSRLTKAAAMINVSALTSQLYQLRWPAHRTVSDPGHPMISPGCRPRT